MRRFYLHKRGNVWYSELVDPVTKCKLTAKSTGKTEKTEALLIVAEWLRDGIPQGHARKPRKAEEVFSVEGVLNGIKTLDLTSKDAEKIADVLKDRGLLVSFTLADGPGAKSVEDFLKEFWTYEESPYVKEKEAHGQSITKGHSSKSLSRIKTYWVPYFKGKRLAEVTKAEVKAFALSLANPEKKLSPASRNRVLIAGKTALHWAFNNDLIAEDVTAGIMGFSGEAKKRGVLNPEEAAGIFALEWKDKRAKVGNLLAMTTGLRAGEIRAIKKEDIGESVLYVRHSWSETDGLKAPKNGEARRVPLLPELRKALLELAEESPYGEDGFVFYGLDAERPMYEGILLDGLMSALDALDVKEDWKGRNIVFHSWRHFYAARMADRVEARKVMMATGHKTKAVFDHYADHAAEGDLAEVGAAAVEAFGKILPFSKVAGI